MNRPLIMLMFVLVFFPPVVIAAETGGLKSVISEYPSHNCSLPPSKPDELGLFGGDESKEQDVVNYNSELADYNSKVDDYNSQTKSYRKCIKEYIRNANSDMSKINEKLNEAIKEANSQ
jgi:hypothetical protein